MKPSLEFIERAAAKVVALLEEHEDLAALLPRYGFGADKDEASDEIQAIVWRAHSDQPVEVLRAVAIALAYGVLLGVHLEREGCPNVAMARARVPPVPPRICMDPMLVT